MRAMATAARAGRLRLGESTQGQKGTRTSRTALTEAHGT